MKCRYCQSEEDLHFKQPYRKGDRPVRAIDGKPHICKNDKPQENMGTSVKERYDPNKFYCGVHRLELNDMVCRRCPKIQIAVRGSELN